MTSPLELVRTWAPWLPLVAVALETAGIPLPLPSELLLVLTGSFVAGHLLALPLVLILGALAGAAGDHTGFLVGRRFGPRVAQRACRRFPGAGRTVTLVTAAVQRFGALAVPLACFIPGVRNVVMLLAGGLGVRYRWFLIADAVGSTAWSTFYVRLGVSLGASWYETVGDRVGWRGLLALLAVLLLAVAAYLYRHRAWLVSLGGGLALVWSRARSTRRPALAVSVASPPDAPRPSRQAGSEPDR